MGAINNAFNQAAGALAGAGIAIKHAKETEESKMNTADNSALIARNQARATEAEANAANDEANKSELRLHTSIAEGTRKYAEKEYEKLKKRKNVSAETVFKKFTELDAAKKAETELKNKYKALVDINNRAEEQRAYAAKATKMALDAKEKFEKRWGGK